MEEQGGTFYNVAKEDSRAQIIWEDSRYYLQQQISTWELYPAMSRLKRNTQLQSIRLLLLSSRSQGVSGSIGGGIHSTWVDLWNLVTPSRDEPTTLKRLHCHCPGVSPHHHRKCCSTSTPRCLVRSAVLSHSTDLPTVVRLHFHPLRVQVHDGSVRRQHLHWKRFCGVLPWLQWTGPELTAADNQAARQSNLYVSRWWTLRFVHTSQSELKFVEGASKLLSRHQRLVETSRAVPAATFPRQFPALHFKIKYQWPFFSLNQSLVFSWAFILMRKFCWRCQCFSAQWC